MLVKLALLRALTEHLPNTLCIGCLEDMSLHAGRLQAPGALVKVAVAAQDEGAAVSARSRAHLAQHELADLLGTPRTQISRWEAGEVEPALATVRRVLRACGFDLSMALVPFDPEAPQAARLVELSRMTPKERLDAALVLGGAQQMGYPLEPYRILAGLEEQGVDYIVVGSLARVLQGADEVPGSFDFVFPQRAYHATDEAVRTFAMRAPGSMGHDGNSFVYLTRGAFIRALEVPKGTRGHRDLRRRAERVHLGAGFARGSHHRGTWCG